jgi:hypothetical protein
MNNTIILKIFKITLLPCHPIKCDTPKFRGFFTTKFKQYPILHQHDGDKLVYDYPLVQYKIIDGVPIIIGINEGADTLKIIYDEFEEINLGGEIYKVIKTFSVKDKEFGMMKDDYKYKFVNPWFALPSKEAYNRYKLLGQEDRNLLLKKRLGSDIVRMSDKLGYRVPEWVKGDLHVEETESWFKGRPMTMFLGSFSANFLIPDYMGIGKSSSRGFGTVKIIGEKFPLE